MSSPSAPQQAGSEAKATRIDIIDEDAATGDTASAYQYCRDTLGRSQVPQLLKCFSHHPTAARAMVDMGLSILFTDGYLTRLQKEMIATFLSARNRCLYCLDSHGYALTTQGATVEAMEAIAAGRLDEAGISPAERELLRFAGKVDTASAAISDVDVQRLRDLAWTQEQIAEAVHTAALMGLCNRVASTFGLASQHLLGTREW